MRERRAAVLAFALLAAAVVAHAGAWPGVDETVVEKYATAAGRSPQAPLLNLGEGDLRLFAFLTAGAVGGFVLGFYFRELFPRKTSSRGKSE